MRLMTVAIHNTCFLQLAERFRCFSNISSRLFQCSLILWKHAFRVNLRQSFVNIKSSDNPSQSSDDALSLSSSENDLVTNQTLHNCV